jgi:hypothetical protein
VWIVLWHDERRGDRNVGVHGVFADEAMARDEADTMNREASCVYWSVNYVVTPGAIPEDRKRRLAAFARECIRNSGGDPDDNANASSRDMAVDSADDLEG